MVILKKEPDNPQDTHAVAVLKEGQVVGHIPYNLAPTIEMFLRRDANKGFAVVTGARTNMDWKYCDIDRLRQLLVDAD